jgi:hypothetical protein
VQKEEARSPLEDLDGAREKLPELSQSYLRESNEFHEFIRPKILKSLFPIILTVMVHFP